MVQEYFELVYCRDFSASQIKTMFPGGKVVTYLPWTLKLGSERSNPIYHRYIEYTRPVDWILRGLVGEPNVPFICTV